MENSEYMELAINKARETMNKSFGGPFGAVIIDKNFNILSISSNSVLKDNDPTAHAEINAIREACKKLNSNNLNDCILYATGYPCPMCLSAIIWANIKTVFYSGLPKDAEKIGFRDNFIYEFIKADCTDEKILKLSQINRSQAIDLFDEYNTKNFKLY